MKLFSMAIIFSMVACGQQSSPEGRSLIRDKQIQEEINLIKEQNKAILDSVSFISRELKALKDR